MKYLVAIAIVVLFSIAAAVWLLSARTQGGVQCPDRVVMLRGRANEPIECVCLDGTLATCFAPGP